MRAPGAIFDYAHWLCSTFPSRPPRSAQGELAWVLQVLSWYCLAAQFNSLAYSRKSKFDSGIETGTLQHEQWTAIYGISATLTFWARQLCDTICQPPTWLLVKDRNKAANHALFAAAPFVLPVHRYGFASWRRSWYRPARGCAELYPSWATLEGVVWRRSKSQQLPGAQQNWQISDVDKAAQIDYTVRTPKLTHPSFAQCRRCFVIWAKRENQAEVKFVTSSKSRFW